MKRPLPIKSVCFDFLFLTLKQLSLVGLTVCVIFYLKNLFNKYQVSDTSLIVIVVVLCLSSVLAVFLFVKRISCKACSARLFKDCAFCHNCGKTQDKLQSKKAHPQFQNLNDEQIKAYLEKAIQSNTMKSLYSLSYLFSFIIPLCLGYLIDFRYALLIFPFFLFSGYIIRPLKHALWNRCPYCSHQTIFSDSQYDHRTFLFCSNCGGNLKIREPSKSSLA